MPRINRGISRHAVSVCPSRFTVDMSKLENFKLFPPSGSQAILVFPQQTAWQYSDVNSPNRCVVCRCRDSAPQLHGELSTLRPRLCYEYGVAEPWQVVTLIAGRKWRSLLMAETTTRNRNVTPKTTEQHLIVSSDKSVVFFFSYACHLP